MFSDKVVELGAVSFGRTRMIRPLPYHDVRVNQPPRKQSHVNDLVVNVSFNNDPSTQSLSLRFCPSSSCERQSRLVGFDPGTEQRAECIPGRDHGPTFLL